MQAREAAKGGRKCHRGITVVQRLPVQMPQRTSSLRAGGTLPPFPPRDFPCKFPGGVAVPCTALEPFRELGRINGQKREP